MQKLQEQIPADRQGWRECRNCRSKFLQLKYRTAEQMMPLVRPLLGPGDGLSGTDFLHAPTRFSKTR